MNRKQRRAEASCQRALATRPDHAQVHYSLGVAFFTRGKLDEAEASFRRAVAHRPDFAEAHNNLGIALTKKGKLNEAVVSFRRALTFRPDFAEAYNNLGNSLGEQGKLDEAVGSYRLALTQWPDYAEAHNNLGNALQKRGSRDEAIVCHRRAIDLKPDFAEAHSNLGRALQQQGRLNEAVACYRRAIELQPNFAEAHSNLGSVLRELGRLDEAIVYHRRTIKLKPDLAEAYYNLGSALLEQGGLHEAYSAFEKAVDLAPRRGAFYRMLANTGRIEPASRHFRLMEELSSDISSLPETEQIELHFALGAVYGDYAQHERSFRHLMAGNRLKRSLITYDEAATLASFDRIRTVFTSELLADGRMAGVPSQLPIFIVGMPRSGTTLVEQILSSHPQVFGAGELSALPRLLDALRPTDGVTGFPETIAVLPMKRLELLGAAYLAGLRACAPSAARIVDKLPDNFLRIGLIRLALPEARIVHIRRDPVDTCLSCFSKLFAGVPYSYDLAELGRFYSAYERLMEHWRQILPPGVMLEVRYEDVVTDLEGQARRILAHCDVTWDDRALAFHKNRRLVRTASAPEVRRPLYGSSVGRWHVFGDLAHALYDALSL
ncbi:MAG: tetratricopeptide repeat protein [Methylocella sp.]